MRLIVLTNRASVAERNALTAFLEGKGWSVWHWFEDAWLIADAPEMAGFSRLKQEISAAIPTLREFMIISTHDTENQRYSIRASPDGIPWIKEHWK